MLHVPAIRCTRLSKLRIKNAAFCTGELLSGSVISTLKSALCQPHRTLSSTFSTSLQFVCSLSSAVCSSSSSSSSSSSFAASVCSLSARGPVSTLQSVGSVLSVCPRRWISLRYNELDDRVRSPFFTVSYGSARALLMNPHHFSTNGTLTPQLLDKLSFQFRTWPNSPDLTVLVLTRGDFQQQQALATSTPTLAPASEGKPAIVDADGGEGRDVIFCNGFDVQWMNAQMRLLNSQRASLEREMNAQWQQQQNLLTSAANPLSLEEAMEETRLQYEKKFAKLRHENLGMKLIRAFQHHAAEMLYVNFPFCVAFDGETSSSGFALGLLTRLRAVTENAVLRFDDAFRGLIPHGGASHVLAHAPHHFGFFLALTGHPLKGFQCVQSGIVPYYTPVDHVRGYLSMMSDTYATFHQLPFSVLEAVSTGTLHKDESSSGMIFPFASQMKLISSIFSQPKLSQVFNSLEEVASSETSDEFDKEFADYCLKQMKAASPLALSVTFRLLRLCERVAPEEALNLEYRLLSRLLTHSDFAAAAKAQTAQGQQTTPVWSHANLSEVSLAEVDSLFSPLYPLQSADPEAISEAEQYELGAEFPDVRPGPFFLNNETL